MVFQKKGNENYTKAIALTKEDASESDLFKVGNDVKSTYDMFGLIFSEIAVLRLEVNRLGTLCRINNSSSPNYLEGYHSHIYSLLLPCSTITSDFIWKKVDNFWIATGQEINNYLNARRNTPNLRIPTELLRKLDKLFRTALLMQQNAGLGIRTEKITDTTASIEAAIMGS